MENFLVISNTYIDNPKSNQKKIICLPNSHDLKLIGGSTNGRSDNKYATVYMCKKCNMMGYIEDFSASPTLNLQGCK